MKFYSVKEASEETNIPLRTIQYNCKKEDIRKKGNRYQITQEHLNNWIKQKQQLAQPYTQPFVLSDIEKMPLEEIEDFDFKFNGVKGNLVFVKKDEVFVNYTPIEYDEAEQKLNEWQNLQTTINHKQEIFDLKLKSISEQAEHYKQQFEYQKKQSTKMLELHERLIENISIQNKLTEQRNYIEVKDKKHDI